jgi:hypothetical protein
LCERETKILLENDGKFIRRKIGGNNSRIILDNDAFLSIENQLIAKLHHKSINRATKIRVG